jgi:large subunit ribosomal protein L13
MKIDGTNLLLGRVASVAAQKALLGESVDIVNCEKIVISGGRDRIYSEYKRKRNLGVPLQGPYVRRSSVEIVKRAIRGMLPYKKEKGKSAFARIRCYKGVPKNLESSKSETLPKADAKKLPNLKYTSIEKISKELGSRK